MATKRGVVTRWLEYSPAFLTLYAIAVSFATYFCMYAFRKPFAAASYDGSLGLIDLKTAFVISQIIGYTLSKYLGIKVCSEMTRGRRAAALIGMILVAQVALLLFAVLPGHLKIIAIFINGLPLGMVWGLVVSYLEGRQTSEMLLAGLSCSFIIASGMVKDVGRYLMNTHGVESYWMPFATGALFFVPFLLAVWMLNQIPQPTREDEIARVEREPMDGRERMAFMRQFLFGLVLLFIAYFFLTAYRDYRDNYGIEIIRQLGYAGDPAIFTKTEMPVAFGVLAALAALNLIKSNKWGLIGAYGIMVFGVTLMGVSTLLLDAGRINGLWWMILVGLGSYLAYVPYGSVLFDRLIAHTGVIGTAVFAIYVADAIGYTGSVGLQLYKDLAASDVSRQEFFRLFTYFMSVLGATMLVASCVHFLRQTPRQRRSVEPTELEAATA